MIAVEKTSDCFPTRVARAGRHVDRGEWASGLALARNSLDCAKRGEGCPFRDDCVCAAELLICDIRRLVAA